MRVIREKLDDNNVRVGSLTQEVDALRQSLQQRSARGRAPHRPSPTRTGRRRRPHGARPPPAGAAGRRRRRRSCSIGARATTTPGQYDLAIAGFDEYIKSFPEVRQADDAQVLHRQRVSQRRQVREGGRSLRRGDPHLSRPATRCPRPTTRRASRSRACDRARRRARGAANHGRSRTYPDSIAGGDSRQQRISNQLRRNDRSSSTRPRRVTSLARL